MPMMPPPMMKEPKSNVQKPKNLADWPRYIFEVVKGFFSRLFYIIKLVWETNPFIMLAMIVISVLSGVAPVFGAFVSARLLNSLAEAYTAAVSGESYAFSTILTLLVLEAVYLFVVGILGTLSNVINRVSGDLVSNNIRLKIMKKAKTLDIANFDMPDFYSKFENANREAGMRPIQILQANFTIISTIIKIVSFVAVLWAVSPFAPFFVFFLAIPGGIVNFIYRKKYFTYVRHRSKDRRQLNYYSDLMVDKNMAKEIRILGLADTFSERYKSIFSQYFKGLKKLFWQEGVWNLGINFVVTLANAALFIWVAYKVFKGELMIGDYSLYTGALNSIISGASTIVSTTAVIYEGTLFIDNLIDFMNMKRTVVPSVENAISPKRHIGHTIEFKNVSFKYPKTQRYVLSNINVKINSGETIMLVGLNGAGKTTLIKLLTRLYDPTEGEILLDGVDIREYDTEALYKIYGIVFQDFGKYAVNVRENIRFGNVYRDATDENIQNAAVQGDADGFIEKLPDKYDTPLMRFFEENGIELSIGQWQKLSIARAFYSDADVLILDEPTASLDALAEQEIYQRFDQLREGRTTILVSHRMSCATTADNIIVLENGTVIEEGNHAKLMELKGKYHELFTTQASRYLDEQGKIEGTSFSPSPPFARG